VHSFLLRLRAEQLSLGEMVGEVEDVRTGERQLLRRTADLVEFCRRVVTGASPDAGGAENSEEQK
jgi:hypothetical protein